MPGFHTAMEAILYADIEASVNTQLNVVEEFFPRTPSVMYAGKSCVNFLVTYYVHAPVQMVRAISHANFT